ncbi:MAG TPA: class II aldolase/adducin family protein [Candidatus Acidoferrum sp.]|jgi:HCOMODA/2-hydroxy-3-carboxy-muconic semialdehyde decarboxylase|nr:class II aldolase/adducin family protein [Candidatus Acidoferrum sp.]
MVAIDAAPALLGDLVTANRILFNRGVVDAFGHVSVRHDRFPDRFLMARNLAPAAVREEDVMAFALDGTPLGGDDRRPTLERFIHGSIYRARPDVGAVVHSHSPAVIPFGVVSGVPLRAICHMSSFLGEGIPIFEIRDAAGPENDMLVRDERLGDALARTLGASAAVLMRGHGSTAVGKDVREAVFRAVYTELNARLQADALRLGPTVTYLSEPEVRGATLANQGQMARAWDLWSKERSPLIEF